MWILLGWCVAKTGGRCYPSLFSSRWSFFPSWYRIRQPLGGAQQVKLRSPLVNRSKKDGLDKEVVVGMTFSGAWFWDDSMIQWPNSDPWCWYIYIYANMTGVYGWDPCYHYYSSTMDPNWVMIPLSLKKPGEIHGIIPWSPSDHQPVAGRGQTATWIGPIWPKDPQRVKTTSVDFALGVSWLNQINGNFRILKWRYCTK